MTMELNTLRKSVSRTNVGILGIDLLRINGKEAIRHAIDSGELKRFEDVIEEIDQLPWLFRWYFRFTRFWSSSHGFFLPFRSTGAEYNKTRQLLDSKFVVGYDMSKEVKAVVDLLESKDPNDIEDFELTKPFMNAMASRFCPVGKKIPDDIFKAATRQAGGVGDAFLPWRFIPAKPNNDKVYGFAEENLKEIGVYDEIPKATTVDVAHSFFATELHGAAILRAIAENVEDEIEKTISSLGRVDQSPRLVEMNSTLNGLLEEGEEAIAKQTIVLLNIGDVAKETKQAAWAFGTGSEERRCAAEPAIVEFCTLVQKEFVSRRSN